MSAPLLKAVVFDVDGVLFDTEQLLHQCWHTVGQGLGWPQAGERYLEFVGQNRTDIGRKMLEFWGPDFPQEEFLQGTSRLAQEVIEAQGVPMKPGVHELLEFLHSRDIPMALATSTGRPRTLRRLELTGLGHYFKVVVTGDMITHSKPEPEIYLLACQLLGVPPQHTMAVEDSRNGILSAYAAGMPTVMIPDLIAPTPELEELLFQRFPSLLALRDYLSALL